MSSSINQYIDNFVANEILPYATPLLSDHLMDLCNPLVDNSQINLYSSLLNDPLPELQLDPINFSSPSEHFTDLCNVFATDSQLINLCSSSFNELASHPQPEIIDLCTPDTPFDPSAPLFESIEMEIVDSWIPDKPLFQQSPPTTIDLITPEHPPTTIDLATPPFISVDFWTSAQEDKDDYIEELTTEEYEEIDRMEAEVLCEDPDIGVHNSTKLPRHIKFLENGHYVIHLNDSIRIQKFEEIGKFIYATRDRIVFTIDQFLQTMKEEETRRRYDPWCTDNYEFPRNKNIKINMYAINSLNDVHSPRAVVCLRQRESSVTSEMATRFELSYNSWALLSKLSNKICHSILKKELSAPFAHMFVAKCLNTPQYLPLIDHEINYELRNLLIRAFYLALFPNGYVGGNNPLTLVDVTRYIVNINLAELVPVYIKLLCAEKINGEYAIEFMTQNFLSSIDMYEVFLEMNNCYDIIYQPDYTSSDEECC